jgi:hypothetical protein|tara:strand:+ start:154 stop:333 length:180 start_codon:yes stop_codon:yes gene_type:complete
MKIDLKYIIGFITTSLFGILSWSLITLIEIKSKTAGVEVELFHINKQIGRIYGTFEKKE